MLTKDEEWTLLKEPYKNRKTLMNLILNGDGHIGGVFSSMDILTVLYNKVLKIDPKKPKWEERDVFLLSAGHKAIGLYVVLQSLGYFEEDILWTLNDLNTKIPTHSDAKLLPGIDFSFGSLGHGLSVGIGIALAFRKNNSARKVFVLMGDGEACEGSVWEAVLGAAKHKLDNITVIIDVNRICGEDYLENELNVLPYENKYRDFGWSVRTIDGHNIFQIYKALKEVPYEVSKPTCIVANTIKGKGIDFCENLVEYHHWCPDLEGFNKAINSIEQCLRREIDRIEQYK